MQIFNDFLLKISQYGRIISVILDVASEILNFNNSKDLTILKYRLDPKNVENALQILNVSESEKENVEYIRFQYDKLIGALEGKKKVLSEPLAREIQFLINDANEALNTLLGKPSE